MSNFFRFCLVLGLCAPSVVACASSEPASTEGASDENITASSGAPADLVTALKKANRTALLPTKNVAWVYRPGVMDAVKLTQDFNSTAPEDALLAQERTLLKTRGFKIVGKTAPFKECEFTAGNDYLGAVSGSTFLTARMKQVNTAIGEVVYSEADFATAKAIEASVSYKLVLTSERLAVYLGKQGATWKIIAIDSAEYSCDA